MSSFLKLLLLSVCLLLAVSVSATDLSKVNFSYLYQVDGVRFNYQVAQKDSIYTLFMTLKYERITQSQTIDSLQLRSQEKFFSKKDTEIQIIDQQMVMTTDGEHRTYTFSANPKHNFITVKAYLNNLYSLFEIPINGSLSIPYPDFITEPMHGIAIGDSVQFSSVAPVMIYAYEYQHDFKVSLPPFVLKPSLDSTKQRLSIVKTHIVALPFVVSDSSNTLYLFQSDTSSLRGHSILTHKPDFPKSQTIEELIEPLIFISTKQEADNIKNNSNKKKAFENFWLNNIPDKKIAAQTIKKYYKSIALANALFSSFKAGWKTDQGMILVIFGSPSRVFKKPDKEIWEYSTFKGDIKFTFAKQSNVFDQNYYILERDEQLTEAWFNKVKKWRKGDI